MGRKSTNKKRKGPLGKTDQWLAGLVAKLQEVDLAALTMDDLASLLGKSKSTLYEYFATKEELLARAVTLKIADLADYRPILKTEQSEIEKYRQVMEFISQQVADVSIGLLQQFQQEYPGIWQLIDGFLQVIIDDLGDLYEQGMAVGHFRRTSIRLLTRMDQFFVTQVITDSAFKAENDLSLEQLVRHYLELRFAGIKAQK